MFLEDNDYMTLLMGRLEFWKPSETEKILFEKYYTNMVENDIIANLDYTVNEIVDNDYVNYCTVIEEGWSRDFKEVKRIFEQEGIGAEFDGRTIEAVDNEKNPKAFLIR